MKEFTKADRISRLQEIKLLAAATQTSLNAYVRSAEAGKMNWFRRKLLQQTELASSDLHEELDRLLSDDRPLNWSTIEELEQVERLAYAVCAEVERLHRKLAKTRPAPNQPAVLQIEEVA